MSVLKILGTRQVNIGGVQVTLAATLEQDDLNGQVFMHVQGSAGQDVVRERASIGAVDGKDALAGLTQAETQAALQKVLDDLRQAVGQRLATLAKVKAGAPNLI